MPFSKSTKPVAAQTDGSLYWRFETNLSLAFLKHNPRHLPSLHVLGTSLTKLGRHEEALRWDLELVRQAPADPVARYNLACSYSNLRRPDDAFAALDDAFRLGWRNLSFLRRDPDLQNLRGDPRYTALLARLRRLRA